jgi:hypothetical protein
VLLVLQLFVGTFFCFMFSFSLLTQIPMASTRCGSGASCGSPPNVRNAMFNLNFFLKDGDGSLHMAVERSNEACVELLIRHGANVNFSYYVRENNKIVLLFASSHLFLNSGSKHRCTRPLSTEMRKLRPSCSGMVLISTAAMKYLRCFCFFLS